MLLPGKGFSMAAPGPYMSPNCHAAARPGYATAWASPALDVGMLWRFAVFVRDIILSALAMHWLWHDKADKWNIVRSGLCCAVQATASHDKAWSGCDCHGHALALTGKGMSMAWHNSRQTGPCPPCRERQWPAGLWGRQLAWGLFDHWLPVWGTVGMKAHHELIQ